MKLRKLLYERKWFEILNSRCLGVATACSKLFRSIQLMWYSPSYITSEDTKTRGLYSVYRPITILYALWWHLQHNVHRLVRQVYIKKYRPPLIETLYLFFWHDLVYNYVYCLSKMKKNGVLLCYGYKGCGRNLFIRKRNTHSTTAIPHILFCAL